MRPIEVIHLVGKAALGNPSEAAPVMFVTSSPCIQIGFFFNKLWQMDNTLLFEYDSCMALIDTGADGVYVDHSLVDKYKCPVASGGEQMVVNNEPNHRAHQGTLFIAEENRCIDMYVMARDFEREARPFSIVLGRRFLQLCNLTWNGPSQEVRLEIGRNPKAY